MNKRFFNFQSTIIILIIIVVAIIAATFIESSAGTEVARKFVYNATWFEVVLALLVLNISGSLFFYRSFSWAKITVPLFHIAFLLIIIGAFFTRYTGLEGTIHIREGERSNTVFFEDGVNKKLSFDIYLQDFVMERYPGSHTPSSFSSFVKVYDNFGERAIDYHIYMNHILKYKGWRFYQTSFDQDEQGTILTATCDIIGTTLTYSGYFLAILLMLASLFMPGSYFRSQLRELKKVAPVLFLLLIPFLGHSEVIDHSKVVPKDQAKKFGELVVQDPSGRMKVLNTLNREFLRKLYGSEKMEGLTADQVALSLLTYPEYWEKVPIIEIKNKEVRNIFGIAGTRISYSQLFDDRDEFLLSAYVDEVFSKPQNARDKTDKAIIEANDDANVLDLFLTMKAFTIFPVQGSQNNKWYSILDANEKTRDYNNSFFLKNIFNLYRIELIMLPETGNSEQADLYLSSVKTYQMNIGSEIYPPESRIIAELIYNRLNPFDKIQYWLALFGFTMTIILFVTVLKGKEFNKWSLISFQSVSLLMLLILISGICLRWIVGGYFPLSNAYEVMIFLSAIGLLTGIVFSKRQPLLLALSMILAFAFLLVAHLNNINPAIGNLVPVLKSYWLSIHVAVITTSYAFFGLVMLISLVNISLFLFVKEQNFKRIVSQINHLGTLNNVLMIIGLYMLTIGTIFGAIWANESWGRYWGWDPKESWALISILVYAFVSHLRLIPSFKDEFITNMASLWAFSTILMTFFGVNYLLSGIHSYSGVGTSNLPVWIWIVVASMVIFTVLSGLRYYTLKGK